jgi:16S rRNA (adenine1518-N6/adenine1519-N6)-dimethyltransferase
MEYHRPRKRFGQNFLHDRGIIDRIVGAVAPRAGQCLVEIGPGQGALTGQLLAANGRLDVIELDRDLAAGLVRRFGGQPGFTLHEGDALKFDFGLIDCADQALRVVGNLPYNISTPLLFHLLHHAGRIQDMTFMLQLEVVRRLAAGPGDDNYGRLGLMMQYYCRVEPLFQVPASAFTPRPKVESAVVRLVPWETLPHPAKNPETLAAVVRTAFNQRRKTVRNSLKSLLTEAQLSALGIDPGKRPENLSLRDYVRISDSLDLKAK